MNIVVLFGVTGDLAKNKIIPVISQITKAPEIQKNISVFGIGRKITPPIGFNEILNSTYLEGELDQPQVYKKLYRQINSLIKSQENNSIICTSINHVVKSVSSNKDTLITKTVCLSIYSSLPPHLHIQIANYIREFVIFPLIKNKKIALRINFLVEKPIGHNAITAKHTIDELDRIFDNTGVSIAYMDHYLAKSGLIMIRNLINTYPIFLKSTIGSSELQELQVLLIEKKDVHDRGVFYDEVGALFDVGQNHLLQVLSEVILARLKFFYTNILDENITNVSNGNESMALNNYIPSSSNDNIAKVSNKKINKIFVKLPSKSVIIDNLRIKGVPKFGQYEGYTQEPGVKFNSGTETYFNIHADMTENFQKKYPAATKGLCFVLLGAKKAEYQKSGILLKYKNRMSEFIDFNTGKDAYMEILEKIIKHNSLPIELFAKKEEIISSWKFVTRAKKLKIKKNTITYKILSDIS